MYENLLSAYGKRKERVMKAMKGVMELLVEKNLFLILILGFFVLSFYFRVVLIVLLGVLVLVELGTESYPQKSLEKEI